VAQEKNRTSKNYKRKREKKRKKKKKTEREKKRKENIFLKKKKKEREGKKRNKWLSMKREHRMSNKNIHKRKGNTISCLLKSAIMKCLCTGDQFRWIDEMAAYGLGRSRRREATSNTNNAQAYEFSIAETSSTLQDAVGLDNEVYFFYL
jgi:predicted methyltransferase